MKYSFKLIIIILFLLTTGCLNDNNLLGERQDIYSDPMLEYLNNDGRKIKLGKLITISNISQTDNGPKHVFSNASFKGLLSKAWEASVIKNGNI